MKSKDVFNPLFGTIFVCNIKGRMADFQNSRSGKNVLPDTYTGCVRVQIILLIQPQVPVLTWQAC